MKSWLSYKYKINQPNNLFRSLINEDTSKILDLFKGESKEQDIRDSERNL